MNNYTTDTYEMKREIVNFSEKIAKGVNKSTSKFISDMQYGISKSGTVLLINISRALNEKINLKYTVDRLSDNLMTLTKEEVKKIKENYIKEVIDLFPAEPIVIFDDSDIAKPYGKKFEDLDEVIDASSMKKGFFVK